MSQLPFDTPADLAFKGETLVFIGRLWSLGRKDARSTVERLGGTCGEDINDDGESPGVRARLEIGHDTCSCRASASRCCDRS
jgi:hypothetical protein